MTVNDIVKEHVKASDKLLKSLHRSPSDQSGIVSDPTGPTCKSTRDCFRTAKRFRDTRLVGIECNKPTYAPPFVNTNSPRLVIIPDVRYPLEVPSENTYPTTDGTPMGARVLRSAGFTKSSDRGEIRTPGPTESADDTEIAE